MQLRIVDRHTGLIWYEDLTDQTTVKDLSLMLLTHKTMFENPTLLVGPVSDPEMDPLPQSLAQHLVDAKR
jgi:hypothetical protein